MGEMQGKRLVVVVAASGTAIRNPSVSGAKLKMTVMLIISQLTNVF